MLYWLKKQVDEISILRCHISVLCDVVVTFRSSVDLGAGYRGSEYPSVYCRRRSVSGAASVECLLMCDKEVIEV